MRSTKTLLFILLAFGFVERQVPAQEPKAKTAPRNQGLARAEITHPRHFPHRIWAASDFEGQTPDFGWFGSQETQNIPRYPGNSTALRGGPAPDGAAYFVGINPVPGPRMGKVNQVYFRYFLKGTDAPRVRQGGRASSRRGGALRRGEALTHVNKPNRSPQRCRGGLWAQGLAACSPGSNRALRARWPRSTHRSGRAQQLR